MNEIGAAIEEEFKKGARLKNKIIFTTKPCKTNFLQKNKKFLHFILTNEK